VQALYQLELKRGVDPEMVVREFARHRFGHEIDGDQYGGRSRAIRRHRPRGDCGLKGLDAEISTVLTEEWPLPRLDAVLRAIRRPCTYELAHRRDAPPRVSISEYIAVAHTFSLAKGRGWRMAFNRAYSEVVAKRPASPLYVFMKNQSKCEALLARGGRAVVGMAPLVSTRPADFQAGSSLGAEHGGVVPAHDPRIEPLKFLWIVA